MTNIIPIPIHTFWNSRIIPIPNRTEIGSANVFLFLFAGGKKYLLITAAALWAQISRYQDHYLTEHHLMGRDTIGKCTSLEYERLGE